MYKFYTSTLAFLVFLSVVSGQTKVDSTLAYQTEPLKGFSLYIPSGYQPATAHPLMLALHPFSPTQWNAAIWRDTLTAFAEANQLILLCPDGGADGKVDDPIDTAFTTFLLDQMANWYHIDPARVYVMGFSWGGRAVYTYGLSHADRFAGFLPVGAAIEGADQIRNLIDHVAGKRFYLVHGGADSPSIRFYPAISTLSAGQACVQQRLLAGVGHTFDFPDRNAILGVAYNWLKTASCSLTTDIPEAEVATQFEETPYPNPVAAGTPFQLTGETGPNPATQASLYDRQGKCIPLNRLPDGSLLPVQAPLPVIYLLRLWAAGKRSHHKLTIY